MNEFTKAELGVVLAEQKRRLAKRLLKQADRLRRKAVRDAKADYPASAREKIGLARELEEEAWRMTDDNQL